MPSELQALLESVAYEPVQVPRELQPVVLPFANHSAALGFPSPAEDFNTEPVDVMKKLMPYPQSMFLLRVKGPSMREDGIFDDDVLVVSKAIKARHGHLVVALLDSEFTVKRLHMRNGRVRLTAANPTYPDIVPKEGETLQIWGVATGLIRIFVKV
jgi:DNA polymerase V